MNERAAPAVPASALTWTGSGRARDVLLNLVAAAAYWAVAELTLWPTAEAGDSVPIWPAAGVAVAALLLGGVRLLPGIAAGAFATFALHGPASLAAALAGATVLEAVVDVGVLRRLAFDRRLERVRDVLILIFVAAPAGALLFALIATMAGIFAGQSSPADLPYSIGMLWMRNSLGVQLVLALALTAAAWKKVSWTWQRRGEAVALLVVLVAFAQLVFGVWPLVSGAHLPLAFMFFPFIGYVGIRLGPAGAASAMALVALLAVPVATMGTGPFASYAPGMKQLVLDLFLLVGSLSGQTLAAVMAEREDAMQRRISLEEQLRHAQKMEAIGRLAGGIAHDFNNLLTAIIGYTEIVMFGFDPKDPRRADAEEIKRAAERAAELTRQMLAFSRRQVLQPKVVDLNVALQKVEPMLRRVIGEDVVMTISAKATRPQVRVDPGQIEQVIMNLVVNARDAMPKGGRLTVETEDSTFDASTVPPDHRPGDYVTLSVSDSGIGMSPEVRARIFEPYFTTKEVGKGTGLGLSTAYGIVQQSEGFIQVFSEPGLGTTFRIHLPRAEGDTTQAGAGDAAMPRGNEHILLVEDDASVRRSTRETLIRLGYSVTEAASGRAGLALGSDDTRHFDLALCDVILGDMSGPAVYEALRALRPSVRVLYMSGYADEAIVRTGVLEDGHPFLQKPFTPTELAVKIREVLEGERE